MIFGVLRVVGVKRVVIWNVALQVVPIYHTRWHHVPEECHFESVGNYTMQYKLVSLYSNLSGTSQFFLIKLVLHVLLALFL